eukprot:TRINITY_DN7841_c0_g1_i3.p1 TRINITY_DN7841_c0_g1~~TRINITY_DN7841_c0_g1_i3.p1  ORF type:complete len:221 (+),score=18.86 TRINITY_DN7841_c0_g1_i3:22-663(+)
MAANWKPPSVDASGFQPHDSRITVMISAQDEDDQGVKRFHAGSYIEVEAKEDFADVFDVVAVEEILPMSGDADSPEMPSATSMSIYYLEPSTTYQIRARFRKDPNAYTAYSPVVKARTCAGPMPRQPAADDVEYAEAKEQEMRDYLADIRAMVEVFHSRRVCACACVGNHVFNVRASHVYHCICDCYALRSLAVHACSEHLTEASYLAFDSLQ